MTVESDFFAELLRERFQTPTPKAPPLVQASAEMIAALLDDLGHGVDEETA